jgi:hypothetical protein
MTESVNVVGVLISGVCLVYGTWLAATGILGVIRHWNTSGTGWEGPSHGLPSYRRLSEYAKSESRLLLGVGFLALGLLVAFALAYFSSH